MDDPNMCCLVYEYAAGGSLDKHLGSSNFGWRKRVEVACSVVSAISFLHKQKCSHRDIKPENICFSADLSQVFLIDFGLAKLVKADHYVSAKTLIHGWSHPYVAPEYMKPPHKYDQFCEVYSIGFVLQALITGRLPKPDSVPLTTKQMQEELKTLQLDEFWDEGAMTKMGEIAVQCMHSAENITRRPTLDKLRVLLVELKDKSEMPRNEAQEEVVLTAIRQTTYNHKGIDGAGPRKCFVCHQDNDSGVFCNRQNDGHYICRICFNEHVRAHLGCIDITCRHNKCTSKPFTEQQLADYLEPQLAYFHITGRNECYRRKEEERRQEEDAQRHKEILEKFLHVAVVHEQLADGQLECPKLYVIARPCSNRGRWAPKFRNILRTKQTYFLYFLCEHDLTKIDHAIEIQKDKEWFVKAAPALLLSLTLIRVALMLGAGAVVAGIFANWLEQIGLDSLVTEAMLTQVFNKDLVSLDLLDRLRNMDSEQGEFPWESIQSDMKRVSPSCFSTIAELAKKDSKWRDKMTWTIRTKKSGQGAWVKNQNVLHWKNS
jgi:serine/threonine protein kinase